MKGKPVVCFCPQSEVKLSKPHNKKACGDEREKALREALVVDTPRSLRAIAIELGLNRKTLSNQFPELSAQVVERFEQFASLQVAERHKQIVALGQRLINELAANGLPLTRKNFEVVAGKGIRPNHLLYRVLLEILPGNKFSANPRS